jgi:hypothetical protein
MSKVYNCKVCSYETKNASNYKRHISSTRHNAKILKICDDDKISVDNIRIHQDGKTLYVCNFCNVTYTRKDSLNRHIKKCSHSKIIQQEQQLRTKNSELLKKSDELSDRNEEIKYYRQLLEINGQKKGSISNFSYIANKYSMANPLHHLTYETFKKHNKIQFISDNDISNDKEDNICDEKYDELLVIDMLYCYRNGRFHKYMANAIRKIFKRKSSDGKQQQKIWVTDPSRLKFMLRIKDDENGKPYWKADCDGILVAKKIIQPILDKIYCLIDDYLDKNCFSSHIDNYDYDCDNYNHSKIMKDIEDLMEMKNKIKSGSFNKKILKDIAPKFMIKHEK